MPKKPQFLPTVTKSRTSVVTPTLNQSHRKLRFPLQLIAINTLYFPYYIQQFLSLSLFQNYLDCEFSTWSLFQVSGGHYTFQVFSLKILAGVHELKPCFPHKTPFSFHLHHHPCFTPTTLSTIFKIAP